MDPLTPTNTAPPITPKGPPPTRVRPFPDSNNPENPIPIYTQLAHYILEYAQWLWTEISYIPAYARGATWENGKLTEPQFPLTWQEIFNLHWKNFSDWLNPEIPSKKDEARGVENNNTLRFILSKEFPVGKFGIDQFRSEFEAAFQLLGHKRDELSRASFHSFKIAKESIPDKLIPMLCEASFNPYEELANSINSMAGQGRGHLEHLHVYILAIKYNLREDRNKTPREAFFVVFYNDKSSWQTVMVGKSN